MSFRDRVATAARNAVEWFGKAVGVRPIIEEIEVTRSDGKKEILPSPKVLLERYSRSLWIYVCASRKARFAAGVPWLLKRRKQDGTDEVVTDHPAIDLLKNPAPGMTWTDLIESVVTYLELTGRCALEKAKVRRPIADGDDEGETVPALFPLMPHRLRPIVSAEHGIDHYIYQPNLKEIRFEPRDVVFLHYFDPLVEFGGVGSQEPAWISDMLDESGRRWNDAFFRRGGTPETIITLTKPVTPAERKRVEEDWKNRYAGTTKARGVAVLSPGMEVNSFNQSAREMQFRDLMRMTREEIMAAFAVPPVLVGLTDQTNYATASIQLAVFRDYVVLPLLRRIFATFDQEILVGIFGADDLYLAPDIEATKTSDERTAEHAAVVLDVQAGILSKDEAREVLGYGPSPEGAGGEDVPDEFPEVEEGKAPEPQADAGGGGGFGAPKFGSNGNGNGHRKVARARGREDVDVVGLVREVAAGERGRSYVRKGERAVTPHQMEKARRKIESAIEPELQDVLAARLDRQRKAVIALIRAKLRVAKRAAENGTAQESEKDAEAVR